MEFGCGQCLGCKIVRKKTWKHRILLEAKEHVQSAFVTLTYEDEHLPKGGTLDPKDIKLFLYKLRKNVSKEYGKKIRYYFIGEYGDQNERPHYHAAIFGIGCNGPNPRDYSNKKCSCRTCTIIGKSWNMGIIGVGTLENDSASYLAGYLNKTVKVDGEVVMGLHNKNNPKVLKWLKGRHPEFTRMSLKHTGS